MKSTGQSDMKRRNQKNAFNRRLNYRWPSQAPGSEAG